MRVVLSNPVVGRRMLTDEYNVRRSLVGREKDEEQENADSQQNQENVAS